jgi:FkbM family methyltransferase
MEYTDVAHHYYGNIRVITHDLGISQWIIKHYVWEEHLLRLILSYIKPNSTIIDIGANIGTHTIGIAKWLTEHGAGAATKLVAFEPQPFIFSILEHNLKSYQSTLDVELHPNGLSDTEMTIYMTMPDYSVVKNPGGYGLEFNIIPDETKTKVDVKRLDDFHYENVSFMKIDVEGHENQVLKGAVETIQICRPVMIIEILGGVLLDNASLEQLEYIHNTVEYIKSMNYSVRLIEACDYICMPNPL